MKAFPDVVRLEEIDWEDDRFAIRSFSSDRRLKASLDSVGILFPPWVWAVEDHKYALVDGFKRLQWAKDKDLESIPCLVFPGVCRYEQLLLLRVEGRLFGTPCNAAEKAQIVAKLARTLPHRYVLDHLLADLGITPRAQVMEKWCRLSEAQEDLLSAVASEAVSERVALELTHWGEEERTEILSLLTEIRCSASIQMEIYERISEIALRQDRQRLALMREPEVQSVLKDQQLNHRQKTQALRELLAGWRFPRLHGRERRFADELKTASLPKRIRILPPPGFEGEHWQLQLTFSGSEELQSLLEKAKGFAQSDLLVTLMKPENTDHTH